jgi:hypothetical protein
LASLCSGRPTSFWAPAALIVSTQTSMVSWWQGWHCLWTPGNPIP